MRALLFGIAAAVVVSCAPFVVEFAIGIGVYILGAIIVTAVGGFAGGCFLIFLADMIGVRGRFMVLAFFFAGSASLYCYLRSFAKDDRKDP